MSANIRPVERWHGDGVTPETSDDDAATTPFVFACPECRTPLESRGDDQLYCPAGQHAFHRGQGIWRMLPAGRVAHFQAFIRDYETIRREEGRGAAGPAYYRNLPFVDVTGRFSEDWRIRATSFEALLKRVIRPIEAQQGRPLTILDMGAGNGWLSNRLAARGHSVVAIDLLTNEVDGLGAHVHYDMEFTPVQAEFDRLPFVDGAFDLVVFNGALHYSTDFVETLREALRVTRAGGRLVIADSPVYRNAASGKAMIRERETEFEYRYGFPSNAIPFENFLTYDRLNELGDSLGLEWRMIQPFYGLSWALRPWKARIRRRREPARFLLIVGLRGQPRAPSSTRVVAALGRRWLAWRYRLTQRHRYDTLVLEDVAGHPMLVLPRVFNPKLLKTGEFLAEALHDGLISPGASVLDMGTGSGVGAIAAAAWAGRVVAVDINPQAVRCARINALLNEAEDTIDVRLGDLFTPVRGERFDVILFNPPYYRGVPQDDLDHAWRSIDVVERFAAELADHLNPGGIALVVLSTDGESESFLESFRANALNVTTVLRRKLVNESLTLYRLSLKG